MKKHILIVAALLCLAFVITSCGGNKNKEEGTTAKPTGGLQISTGDGNGDSVSWDDIAGDNNSTTAATTGGDNTPGDNTPGDNTPTEAPTTDGNTPGGDTPGEKEGGLNQGTDDEGGKFGELIPIG